MTYQADEQSVSNAKPVELYRFVGTYANYYYTSGTAVVPYQAADDTASHDYQPIALKRSEIVVGTQDDDNTELTLQMKATNQIVLDYGFETSPPKLELTIFRYHDIADVKRVWFGDVSHIQIDDGVATLRSPSLLSSVLSAQAPNVYYQTPCNNILFDARCKVVEATWSHAAHVTAVAGKAITLDGLGTLGGQLIGGELSLASGERRMIVAQAGNVVTVNFPFAKLLVGTACGITAGCDHLYSGDCKNKFGNRRNFGGFVFIPPENPFTSGIDPSSNPIADATCLPPRVVFEGWWLKVRVDFWRGSGGPNSGPAHWLHVDYDNNGTVDTIGPTYTLPNGASGCGPGSIVSLSSPNPVEGIEYTFFQSCFATDVSIGPRRFQLRLQFPAFSVPGSDPRAVVSVLKWHDTAYVEVAPIGGYSSLAGNAFDIQGLWPRDYDFLF